MKKPTNVVKDGILLEPISWADVKVGSIVYLAGTKEGWPYAYGPHIVHDKEKRQLRNWARDTTFFHYPEELLQNPNVTESSKSGHRNHLYIVMFRPPDENDFEEIYDIRHYDMKVAPPHDLHELITEAYDELPHGGKMVVHKGLPNWVTI